MEIIKKQLESGVEDVKFRRNNSMPPLHYAGIEGYHEVLSFFDQPRWNRFQPQLLATGCRRKSDSPVVDGEDHADSFEGKPH